MAHRLIPLTSPLFFHFTLPLSLPSIPPAASVRLSRTARDLWLQQYTPY
jgi:hypothetical protein